MKRNLFQKPSIRFRVQRRRKAWRMCRYITTLKVHQFQTYLEKELRDLVLDEEGRRFYWESLGEPPPEDARFWSALGRVELCEHQGCVEQGDNLDRQREAYLRGPDGFVRDLGEPVPTSWISAACRVLRLLTTLRTDAREVLSLSSDRERHLWEEGSEQGLVNIVQVDGVQEPWVQRAISELQQRQTEGTLLERERAMETLQKVGKALWEVGQGREEITQEEKEAIVVACQKWRPICERLNKAFKQLWKISNYKNSELYRKEARGRLADKFAISVADVEAVEWSLKNLKRRGRKNTPTDAMFHRVAREFFGRGEKTIERIWLAYLKSYPDQKAKKRKKSPHPVIKSSS